MREMIRAKDFSIGEQYAETRRDLSAPSYKYDSAGRIVIQSKEELKKEMGCSPDFGDSAVLSISRSGSFFGGWA